MNRKQWFFQSILSGQTLAMLVFLLGSQLACPGGNAWADTALPNPQPVPAQRVPSTAATPAQPVYPIVRTASGVSRIIQTVTGFTPMSSWMANRMLRRVLARHIKGSTQSHMTLFSGTDLMGRKVKRLTVSGEHVMLNGFVPLTSFRFETMKDMPVFMSKNSRPVLLRPLDCSFSLVMSAQDINRMLQSPLGKQVLTGLRLNLPPFGPQSMDILNPAVTMADDRLRITALMNIHGAPLENALPVQVSGHLVAKQSRLLLSDVALEIPGLEDTQPLEQVIEDYFSELVNLNRVKVSRHRVRVDIRQAVLQDNALHLESQLEITPDRKVLDRILNRR